MDGAVAYGPLLSETNPPVIIWMSALPVALARATHLSEISCMKELTLLLMLGSAAWSFRIAGRAPSLISPFSRACLALAVFGVEAALQPSNFSQREHLLVILLTPYLLAVATGAESELPLGEKLAIGVVAAVGIWLKPYEILVPIGLQVWQAFRNRDPKRLVGPCFLGLAAGCFAILAAVLAFAPLYFRETVPILQQTYWAIGSLKASAVAAGLRLYTLLVIGLSLALYVERRKLAAPHMIVGLILSSVLASVACDLQHTLWTYHRYPHAALLLLAAAYFAIDRFRNPLSRIALRQGWSKSCAVAVGVGLVGAVCLSALGLGPRPPRETSEGASLSSYFGQLPSGTTVYVMSTEVPPMAEAYRHNLTWGSRFAHLWMLPALVKNEEGVSSPKSPFKRLSPETLARLSTLLRTEVAEDLDRWQPSFVLIPTCSREKYCFALEDISFETLPWFLHGADFAKAWSQYQKVPVRVGSYDVYQRVAEAARGTKPSAQPGF